MSGHQPPVGRGALAEVSTGDRGGHGAGPRPARANATVGGRHTASSHIGPKQPAAPATSRGAGPELAPDRPPNHRRALPTAAARLHSAPARWPRRDASKAQRPPTRIASSYKEPIVRDLTLWQIDMGDGTWAVSCRTCRLSYRGPKAGADLLFDTHQCEPVLPLPPQTR
jgi:hypothetical protein